MNISNPHTDTTFSTDTAARPWAERADLPVWVVSDSAGHILEASAAAAKLLAISAGHLRRRSLVLFFHEDRPAWNGLLAEAARGHAVERAGWIRPRDRRPRAVLVHVAPARDYPLAKAILWQFSTE